MKWSSKGSRRPTSMNRKPTWPLTKVRTPKSRKLGRMPIVGKGAGKNTYYGV